MKTIILLLVTFFSVVLIPLISHGEEIVTIGVPVALSGGIAAEWGTGELNGITLAAEEWQKAGKQPAIKLATEDTQGSSASTVTAVQRLLSIHKAKLIIGPTWLDSYQGAIPLASKSGALMITPSGGQIIRPLADKDRTIFSTWYNVHAELVALAAMIPSHFKRIVLIFDQDSYNDDLARQLEAILKERGHKILKRYSVPVDETNFQTIFAKINTQKPDAIVGGLVSEGSYIAFFKQYKNLIDKRIAYFAPHDIESLRENPNFTNLLSGITYIYPKVVDTSFAQKYKERFKSTQLPISASCAYDAMNILLDALSHNMRSVEEITEYMYAHEFRSATYGKIKFTPFGVIEGGEYEVRRIS